jgi:ABC-type multidrug transport system ATPase subunit
MAVANASTSHYLQKNILSMSPVLSIHDLTKFYGSIQALNNVSFSVPPGSVFGILGPNGSGKTTLLGIVMDILKPTSGNFQRSGPYWKHPTSTIIYPAKKTFVLLQRSKERV